MDEFRVLRKMRADLLDLMDRIDLMELAGLSPEKHKADVWKMRTEAYRILVKLFDRGYDVRLTAGQFGWYAEHLESQTMRNWLCRDEAISSPAGNVSKSSPEEFPEEVADIAEKSAETPELASHHAPIGTHGIWGSKHPKLQYPAYLQNIRNALMRAGHSEGEAHAMAIAALRRWAKGDLKWGPHRHVTPEVQEASRRALEEYDKLRRDHP